MSKFEMDLERGGTLIGGGVPMAYSTGALLAAAQSPAFVYLIIRQMGLIAGVPPEDNAVHLSTEEARTLAHRLIRAADEAQYDCSPTRGRARFRF